VFSDRLLVVAVAFGINHGLLDRATYLPVVTEAWKFMSTTGAHFLYFISKLSLIYTLN